MVQNIDCEPVQVAGGEMIQFTVAIPTYNGESGYLSKVLDALLKQKTKVEWELIVVDNNSKDDTKKLVIV
jgi:glycosyltransferase involved in cell wall biosynthesis